MLLHGLAARWQAFGPLLPALSQDWRIVAPDFRGHGGSDHAPGTYRVPQLVDDVAAVLDDLGTGPVVVYGHSLGGWVGLTLAAREPERVRALIIGDTGIDPRGIDPDLAVSYLADVPMALRSLAQAVRVMDPAVMQEFRAGTLADEFRPEDVLPRVHCPVLLLQADPAEGGLMTDSDAALGRRLLPDVAHVKFTGVGHGLHVEAADAVAAALEPLFARLDAADGRSRGVGMGDELPGDVLEYLRANSILSLASATPDGTPHATTLTYVNDGATFYVWMRPETLTARQLDANPRVAFTIDNYGEGGRAAEGVQASGEARQVLQPAERTRLLGMFAEKFPGIDTSEARHLTFFKLLATQLHHIFSPQEPKLGATYNRELVFSVFRELPAEAVDELTANLETQGYRDGEVIVRQGAPADKFFIIVSGDVEVLRSDSEGERTVGSLKAGQFFGEIAILRDSPRTATVRAKGDVEVLAMHRDTFRDLVARSLGTTVRLDEIVSERLTGLQA